MSLQEIRLIANKSNNGEFISVDEAAKLFAVHKNDELEFIRASANELREKLTGDKVSYTAVSYTHLRRRRCKHAYNTPRSR